jgi:chromosome segregation ATPase
MNDAVVEKMIQQVANLVGEVNDVNILVRRMSPSAETVNKIHERIDAMYTAIRQIEKELKFDEKRLNELGAQTKSLMEEQSQRAERLTGYMYEFSQGMDKLSKSMSNLENHVKWVDQRNNEELLKVKKEIKDRFDGLIFTLVMVGLLVLMFVIGVYHQK